jgi:hypothetical protein
MWHAFSPEASKGEAFAARLFEIEWNLGLDDLFDEERKGGSAMLKFRMLVAFLVVAWLVGCTPVSITGSGNVVTQEEPITGFDKVDVSQGFNVDIRQAEQFSVVIRVDDNVLPYLQVVKQGATLNIGLEPGRVYGIRNATMQAEVTMPELAGLDLSGGSQAAITGFKSTGALSVSMSGGSRLQGDIQAGAASFELSGASDMTLSGSAQDVRIDASGGSQLDLADFPVAGANISVSGASQATVNPSGRLDVSASGASRVYYLGNPTLGTVDTSGASAVEPR